MGLYVYKCILLAIMAVVGVILFVYQRRETEAFQDFAFRPCTVYYTDAAATSEAEEIDLRRACDEGEFEHSPVYYDGMIRKEPGKYAKLKRVYTSLPTRKVDDGRTKYESKKTCKLTMPGWKQFWETAPPPVLSPVSASDPRGDPINWAFCAQPNSDDAVQDIQVVESARASGVAFDHNPDGTPTVFPMNGDFYVRSRFKDMSVDAVAPMYCNRVSGPNATFQQGMVLTLNDKMEVIDIKYVWNGVAGPKDADHIDVVKLFGGMFSDQQVRTLGAKEYTYVVPQWANFSVVKMSKDICNQDTKTPVGSIDMRFRFDNTSGPDVPAELRDTIILKTVTLNQTTLEQFDVNNHLMGTGAQIQTNSAQLTLRGAADAVQYNQAHADLLIQQTQVIPPASVAAQATYNDLVWTTAKIRDLQNQAAAALAHMPPPNTSVLTTNQILYSDGMNTMRNGPYSFTLRPDGVGVMQMNGANVYYTPVWRAANPPCFMIMQTDGNLVTYDAAGALWASGTNGRPVQSLILDAGGLLYLHCTNGVNLNLRLPPVYVLGGFGMGPWGGSSGLRGSASWIWNIPGAAGWAPPGVTISFSKQYDNTSGQAIRATAYLIVDDYGTVYLNGQRIRDISGGWWPGSINTMQLTLPPGISTLHVNCVNGGGPAGLVGTVFDNTQNVQLFQTDATWSWTQ